MEASPPGAGPRRPSSTPGVGPTAEAGGDPATAVGAPGRGGARSGGLRHEPVDVPADRGRHPSPVQGGLPSGSRRATAAGVWLQSAAAPAAREGARRSSRAFARDRKSTRLNSSHLGNSYAVFCLKKTGDDGEESDWAKD